MNARVIQVRPSRNPRWRKQGGWEVFEAEGVCAVCCGEKRACVPRTTERICAVSVGVPTKPIARWVIALAFATSWTSLNLWAHQDETELLKQAHITKHQAKKIALRRVKRGAIKRVGLEKENGVLIWSVDVAQPRKKDLTDVWIDATTGKITTVELETPLVEKKEIAEQKAEKWQAHQSSY